jgi:hypothetical protein
MRCAIKLLNIGQRGGHAPTDGQTTQQLVAERLALRHSGQAPILDLFGVELDGALGEFEPLLDERGELADPAALLAEDLLGVGGADDDFRPGVRYADLAARVALRGQLAHEELGQFGVEDA